MPKVTVLMPVYNGAPYLSSSIESILSQTFTDFEYLIIDDGSTDNSVEIINSYQDNRIKLLQNSQNLGISKSLNIGLSLATGEYIARMDCDDISMPNRFQKQVDFLNTHKDITILGCYMQAIDSEEHELNCQYRYPLVDEEIVYAMLHSNPMAHPSVCLRRLDMVDIGGYRCMEQWNNGSEDYDLWLRAATKNYKFANLDEFLIKYRVHTDSLTQVAIDKGMLSEGFNNCFYLSGTGLFGCTPQELRSLRERKHTLIISLFIKIAGHISKRHGKNTIEVLQSHSFRVCMQNSTSNKDIISRLVISILQEKPLTSLYKETSSILKQALTKISRIIRKLKYA